MIKVVVDGVDVYVERGSTVLQACESLGIEIPRFCYHERLSIAGNCRMCLVEIFKTPKPVAACAMPTMEGMQIFTNTPLVKKAREAVLEFLLLNHPLDCPICDQGGECDLQDQAMAFGSDRSRFFESKRGVENKNCGPLIKTIMTRCIHCTRCVRFATEVAGVEDLGTTGRGTETEIGTYLEKAFRSEVSGNVIDLCPVGALTSKTYAFVARPWELRSTHSVDLSDGLGSNLRIDSRGTSILRVLPRFHEEINEEWLSDKARFAYDGLSLQRMDQPYLRSEKGGNLQPCTWEEALTALGDRLRSTDGAALQGLLGKSVDSATSLAFQALFRQLGSPHLQLEGGGLGQDPDLRGAYAFGQSLEEVEKADLCLLVGVDPRYEASVLNLRLRKRFLEGGFEVGRVGAPTDLTYPHHHLGTSLTSLARLVEGRDPFAQRLAQAEAPLLLVGGPLLTGPEAPHLDHLLTHLSDRLPQLRVWTLPSGGNQVGQQDLGLAGGKPGSLSPHPQVLYLLGTEDASFPSLSEEAETFVVYQGTHGEGSAARADLVLPGAAFTEKAGLYVNAEGRPQEASPVFRAPGLAREDWKILRALSEVLGGTVETLPYEGPADLSQGLGESAPSFLQVSQVLPSTFSPQDFQSRVESSVTLSSQPLPRGVLDFYRTDAQSRASRVMTTCSSLFQGSSNFLETTKTL